MFSRILYFLAAAVVLAGCSSDDSPAETPATATERPSATATPTNTRTAIPTATDTARPTATPTPDGDALAAAGEVAFAETLGGIRNREQEAIDLLSAATLANPGDGRSFFLLGMMHLYRAGQKLTDYRRPSELVLAESERAQAALDHAVPLSADDLRVPGFRGAATYLNGVLNDDAERRELGLRQLRAAIDLYPDFNNFSFLGAVAPVVPPDDPLFLEALELVRLALASGCGPFTQPTICGNEGKAPHNVQGAMLIFGDMFTKAGDANQARVYYGLGLALDGASTWSFRAAAEQRMETAEQRAILWNDEDPDNDPPFAGNGSEACAICHH